jgi:Flp pilus assembly protein TadD
MRQLNYGLVFAGLLVLSGCAATPTSQQASQQESDQSDLDYHLLLAEIARERQQYEDAARHYTDAAVLSDDPRIAEQATLIAYEVGLNDVGLTAARRWRDLRADDVRVYRFLGAFELRNDNVEQATEEFARLLRGTDDLASGMELMLSYLGPESNAPGATRVMADLLKEFAPTAEGGYALGRLALRSGDFELALRGARQATELKPDWLDAQLLESRALFVAGEVEQGLLLAEYLAEQHSEQEVRLQYAELLLAAGRNDEARQLLNGVLADEPGLEEAVRALAFLELTDGDLDAAEVHFNELKLGRRFRNEAFYYLGRIAENKQEFLQALRAYRRVTTGSSVVDAQERVSRILLLQLDDPDGALRHLEDFGEGNPVYASEMLLARSRLLVQMDRSDDAMALLESALEDNPDDQELLQAEVQFYAFLSQRALAENRLDEAAELVKEALTKHPEDRALRYQQAMVLERQGKLRRSIRALKNLVAERPDDASTLNALGYTLTDRTNRHAEAEGYIRRALALDPDNPAIVDSMGWVMFKQGQFEQAVDYLTRAYALQRDPEIAAHLVEVWLELGSAEQARATLEAALEDFPEHPVLMGLKGRVVP